MSTQIESKSYQIKFLKKIREAKDTYSFYFARPESFEFSAGQYNKWTLPETSSEDKILSHFFTISSSPTDNTIAFTTKINESEYKKILMRMNEGYEIKIFGPMGEFVLEEADRRPRILLAGGIGITPFYSMIRYVSSQNLNLSLTLIASFSTPEEIPFVDVLSSLPKQFKSIQNIVTITHPEESSKEWVGEKGRISEELIKKYVNDIPGSLYYVAGPAPMVAGTKQLLSALGVLAENIHLEEFPGY